MKFLNAEGLFYATKESAAFDLKSQEDVFLDVGEARAISTGLFIDQSNKSESQEALLILPRSGLAFKFMVTVMNSPGLVDSDYGQEIKVILVNHGKRVFEIKQGDRIAQGLVINFSRAENILVKDDARLGGFGSTGVK